MRKAKSNGGGNGGGLRLLEAARAVLATAKKYKRKDGTVTREQIQDHAPSRFSNNSVDKKIILLLRKGMLEKVKRGVYRVL